MKLNNFSSFLFPSLETCPSRSCFNISIKNEEKIRMKEAID
jgi:hypothetical protein